MPGMAYRYEHVGVCFLNECDTRTVSVLQDLTGGGHGFIIRPP
jgi:hypothetical protein